MNRQVQVRKHTKCQAFLDRLLTVSLRVWGSNCTSSHCKTRCGHRMSKSMVTAARYLNTRANRVRATNVEQRSSEKVHIPVNALGFYQEVMHRPNAMQRTNGTFPHERGPPYQAPGFGVRVHSTMHSAWASLTLCAAMPIGNSIAKQWAVCGCLQLFKQRAGPICRRSVSVAFVTRQLRAPLSLLRSAPPCMRAHDITSSTSF